MFTAMIKKIIFTQNGRVIDDLDEFIPINPYNFELLVEIYVGIDALTDGSDRFDLFVCSIDSIREKLKKESCISGHGMLIVETYSYSKIMKFISNSISMCKGDSVDDVMRRVGLFGSWESEWELNSRS